VKYVCEGCGQPVTGPDDIAAECHIVEGPAALTRVMRMGFDGDLYESWEPTDPRYQCGPVRPEAAT